METITLDFEFRKYSREYGDFLSLCYSYPNVAVNSAVSYYWNYFSADCLLVTVDSVEELAIILKLKFSSYIKIRPTAAELKEEQDRMKIHNARMSEKSKVKYDFYTNLEQSFIKIEDMEKTYERLKMISENYTKGVV